MASAFLGIAMIVGDLWLIIALALALAVIQSGVIKREEVYLKKKLGKTYSEYKKTTPR